MAKKEMTKTPIEWCDYSVNPIRARAKGTGKVGHWCKRETPGCDHCYAAGINRRFGTGCGYGEGARGKVELFLDEEVLERPAGRETPARIFWCDMTDMFGEWVPEEWQKKCFEAMAAAPWHLHFVLTKRADVMEAFLGWRKVLGNVVVGVSGEDNTEAWGRLDRMKGVSESGWKTFMSYEPALESVEWEDMPCDFRTDRPFNWLVAGGETGSAARPAELGWFRDARDFCVGKGIPFFFKQAGGRGKKTAEGRLLGGRMWEEELPMPREENRKWFGEEA